MTRWRYTVWLRERPEVKVKKHRQSSCKLCVISQCHTLATEVTLAHHLAPTQVAWKVERLRGVVDGWEIVYTSEMPRVTVCRRHAHT